METLFVYPNPWSALDKDGHPCGVCPRDPIADAGGPAQFVGARIDPSRTQFLQDFGRMAPHELRSRQQSTKYSYLGIASDDTELAAKLLAKEPVEIPSTAYYRDRLREGSLIPANRASATSARLERFTEPKSFFARYARAPELQGVELPADGVEREVEVSASARKRGPKPDTEVTT